MKKSERRFIAAVVLIGLAVLSAWYVTDRLSVLQLAIDMTFNGYEPSFEPALSLARIPRYQAFQQGYAQSTQPLEWFGISSVYMDINITVQNDQGSIWIFQRFLIDTLAEQKLVAQRAYDPAMKSSSVTLMLDFFMKIDRVAPDLPIERTWHGSWNITLPDL